jgi:hypothetical protein
VEWELRDRSLPGGFAQWDRHPSQRNPTENLVRAGINFKFNF